jgi:hypothetical protein
MNPMRRALAAVVATCISFAGMTHSAQAAWIGADDVAAATAQAQSTDAHSRLAAALQRDDVIAALQARGVSPDQARARVAALSDAEAAQLAEQIDAVPAGGDVLGTIVFVFVLLLITDILGFTKIFPFTRSIR